MKPSHPPLPCVPTPLPRAARSELEALRLEHRRRAPRGGLARWQRRYVVWICDYLLAQLSERELPGWRLAFIALHELVAVAWGARPRGVGVAAAERLAWARLDVDAHLRFAREHGRLPRGFDHARFVPHYQGFVCFLAERHAVAPLDTIRLVADYGRQRRVAAAA